MEIGFRQKLPLLISTHFKTYKPLKHLSDACYFNGVAYGQDQTWSENCKLTCKCTDAARGFYQCSEM